jgi:hypothetical protein
MLVSDWHYAPYHSLVAPGGLYHRWFLLFWDHFETRVAFQQTNSIFTFLHPKNLHLPSTPSYVEVKTDHQISIHEVKMESRDQSSSSFH